MTALPVTRWVGDGRTKVIFLGGVGEIGRNMTVFEHDGRFLIIDVGFMFPTEEMLGVDIVLPDFGFLRGREDDIEGVVLTHGHEDHVGGLPYLLREMELDIYASRLTVGLVTPKLEEHRVIDQANLIEVETPGRLKLGPFDLSFFAMAHSIPDAISTVIETPSAKIVHTGDFKLDFDEEGSPIGLEGLFSKALGADLLMADSTNAETPGHTPSEKIVAEEIARVIDRAPGRVVVACFASNIHRVQLIASAAEAAGRLVALVGRSMVNNVRVARELGYLHVADGTIIPIDEAGGIPSEHLVIICTGSQGEPLSALSLMAAKDHKYIDLDEDDTVVVSATPIPGNESAVRRVIDGLFRIGVDVVHPPESPVHVSGHASAEDLKYLISQVKPKWFVPIHGEYRHLATHVRLAQQVGVPAERCLIAQDGDVLAIDPDGLQKIDRIEAGYVLVDGVGIGQVGDEVLRDRRLLADEGFIVCVVTIDSQTGELISEPELMSRGFAIEEHAEEFFEKARAEIRESLANLAEDGVTEWAAIRRAVRKSLGTLVWRQTRRRPILLPVVVEV